MPVTSTDIANMALGVLDEAPIVNISDDNTAARLCNRHYDQTRKAELQKHAWVFAITSDELTGTDLDTGDGTLNWSFAVPAAALRILPLTYDGEPQGIPISWRREGSVILTDQESPRIVRYITDVTNPDNFNALFTEVLVAALAVKIALPLTHKTGMLQIAQQAYDRALDAARTANAFQMGSQLYTQGWSTARGDNRFWRA